MRQETRRLPSQKEEAPAWDASRRRVARFELTGDSRIGKLNLAWEPACYPSGYTAGALLQRVAPPPCFHGGFSAVFQKPQNMLDADS
jgi:hypothetical protein